MAAPDNNNEKFKEEIKGIIEETTKAAAAEAANEAIKGVRRGLTTKNTAIDIFLLAAFIITPLYYALAKVVKGDIDLSQLNNAAAITFQKQNQDEFDQLVSRALTYAKQYYKPNLMFGDWLIQSEVNDNLAKYCKDIIKLLGKKGEENPKETSDYYLFLGLHYCGITSESADFPDNAIENFNKYLDINPLDEVVWVNLGLVYEVKGEYETAIEMYDRSLECDRSYCRAHYNKALALFRNRPQEEAISEIDELIRRHPDCAEAYFTKGLLCYNTGSPQETDDYLSEAYEKGFKDLNWLVYTSFLDDGYRRQSETYKHVLRKLAEYAYLEEKEIEKLLNF